jgi:pentatricopeptide repeat protein
MGNNVKESGYCHINSRNIYPCRFALFYNKKGALLLSSFLICRFTPDLCSYTTMLSAYVNASDMEGAEKFFRRLKQDGYEPNVVTYGALIKGYAKTNNLEKMMEKYEEMQACGVKANQTVLTSIMDAYGKNRDFGSAVVWYKEMESCGFSPDQKAKNILLSLAKTAEEQEEADQLARNLDQSGNEQRANRVSRFIDEDYEDDNEDVYDDDAEEAINGDNRNSLEDLHTLDSLHL